MKSINDSLFSEMKITNEEMNSLNGGGQTCEGGRNTYVMQNGDYIWYSDGNVPDILSEGWR